MSGHPTFTRGPIVQITGRLFEDDSAPDQTTEEARPTTPHDCADCLLDVNGAAELLAVSAKWVYVNYKTLPHVQIGSGIRPRLRFRRKALLDWMDRREIDWRRK